MKTLTFYQFLDMISKTHCNVFSITMENGFWIAYLGLPDGDNSLFAIWKSRPFKMSLKRDKIIETARLYGLLFLPYPSNIFSH